MKSVLISIKPQWCEKIASGRKSFELRKFAPKEVPFKAYIYCCKGKPYLYRVDDDDNFELARTLRAKVEGYVKDYNEQNGKVIGEFICDKTYPIKAYTFDGGDAARGRWKLIQTFLPAEKEHKILFGTCLSTDEMYDYIGEGKFGYAWHISNLKIYDKPKELSEFKTPPCEKPEKACGTCKYHVVINTPDMYEVDCFVANGREISRPPQSYMHVKEICL